MKLEELLTASGEGYFGSYGRRFVAETLVEPLDELAAAFDKARRDPSFQHELSVLLADFSGRPTPLYFAERLTEFAGGARLLLKREDLGHTGSHKINNALGQVLLAMRMGKRRIIAETGAGQHGVATATVCARFGLECVVYMGAEDMQRQALNVFRMQLMGAEVRAVDADRAHLERCDQRSPARLGDERSRHVLSARLRSRSASISDDGAGFSAGDWR